jgi:hypothetical protein
MRELLKQITISWVFLAGLTYSAHVTGWPAMLRSPEWIISYGNQRYSLDYNLNLVIRLEDGRTLKLSQGDLKAIADKKEAGL